MSFSVFSALMAMLCGSVIILAIHFLRKRPIFLKRFGVSTILFLYAICVFRLLFAFEFPFTKVVEWSEGLNGFYQAVYFDKIPLAGTVEVNIVTLACFLWIVVALVLTAVFLYKYLAVQRRVRAYTIQENHEAAGILEEIKAASARKLNVCVYTCPITETPVSMGIRCKLILLPEKPCSEEELRYILKHEYTHHHHHDPLTIFLVRLFCCIFWWNPLVYLLRNDVLQMLEIKCDLTVTREMSKSEISEYLTTIVNALKTAGGHDKTFLGSAALVLPFKKKTSFSVVERFKMVTQREKGNSRAFQAAFLALFIALFFASYLFILQPGWDPPTEEITENDRYVETNSEESYLLKHKDGTWSQVFQNGLVADLSEETAKVFIQDGIEVKEE